MPFPVHRMRRLRASEPIRRLVRETRLSPAQFILPLFICPGQGVRREISAMPGHAQMSVDEAIRECAEAQSLGIGGVVLFGPPPTQGGTPPCAYAEEGIVQRAPRGIQRRKPR